MKVQALIFWSVGNTLAPSCDLSGWPLKWTDSTEQLAERRKTWNLQPNMNKMFFCWDLEKAGRGNKPRDRYKDNTFFQIWWRTVWWSELFWPLLKIIRFTQEYCQDIQKSKIFHIQPAERDRKMHSGWQDVHV